MAVRILGFFLVVFSGLFGSQAKAYTQVNGKQCKEHLRPITKIESRRYLVSNGKSEAPFYVINNEITNVLGTPLDKISQVESENSLVQSFVKSTQRTIKNCNKYCGGLVDCKNLSKQSIRFLGKQIRSIKDESISVVQYEKPAIARPYEAEKDSDSTEVVVNAESNSEVVVVAENNAETTVSSEKPIQYNPDAAILLERLTMDPEYPTRKECIDLDDLDSELCKIYKVVSEVDLAKEKQRLILQKQDMTEQECMFDSDCFSELSSQ